MKRLTVTTRITICLACLLLTAILAAEILGLYPDVTSVRQADRAALCETMAINCSLLAGQGDFRAIRSNLDAVVERNPEIVSAGLRGNGNELIVTSGPHRDRSAIAEDEIARETNVFVPIIANGERWGTVEVCFTPLRRAGVLGLILSPFFRFCVFVTMLSVMLYFLFLRKTLRQIDPSRVVPDRVRTALDTLAEGLLVLDSKKRIALANSAFAQKVGCEADELLGRDVTALSWKASDETETDELLPWDRVQADNKSATGVQLSLQVADRSPKTFMVNSAPIFGDDGTPRGMLASFDDVTELEAQRLELIRSLEELQDSREEIQKQNRELQVLATRDSLTGCLNRRAFFEGFETHWSSAKRHGHSLACVLVDVDHFKAINDEYGHSIGDAVLKNVAESLQSEARDSDIVCRYGGEEFCVLLPFVDMEGAEQAANRMRQAIEKLCLVEIRVTASFGVSDLSQEAKDPQQLLDQADKCLYVAKREGRNRVMCWHANMEQDETVHAENTVSTADANDVKDAAIPFHAVSALLAALSFRDAETAAHSTRVADLCVATARGMMSVSDTYVLEMAALLHDIGKIGVPDSILLKPGALTEEEWKLMKFNDRMGVEILRSSFASPRLAEIVETHQAWFGGREEAPDLPTGGDIPLGSRILAIADAYDSMVTDRVYRKGRTPQDAFAELRRCAGTQFDAQLVERFVSVVNVQLAVGKNGLETTDKETAHQIGIQLERLARSIDHQDFDGIAGLASMLEETGKKFDIEDISKAAADLKKAASEDPELRTVVRLAHELLDLCRATRRAYIHAATGRFTREVGDAAVSEEKVVEQ